ncbi:MAG: hypothetical protein ACI35W_04040 [Anaeroplasmataceae bacterium]
MAADLTYETLVTNDDYLRFAGIDLNTELSSRIVNDVGDSPAPRFIWGIEDWCKDHLMLNYTWNGELVTEHQRTFFKKGVMFQIQYVLRNGNISNDSGYNMSTGGIVPREVLDRIGMSSNAYKCFRLGGMANIGSGGNYDRYR